jgi:N-methylhydantoinase A/oxoprolinase/acetone carboxylase beta subunit
MRARAGWHIGIDSGGTFTDSIESRQVLVAPGEWGDAKIVKRDDLAVGHRLEGQALIEEPDSTTYVPLGFTAEVHPTWCLIEASSGASGRTSGAPDQEAS